MLVIRFVSIFAATTLGLFAQPGLADTPATEAIPTQAEPAEPIYQVEFLVLRPYQRNELANETWSEQKPDTPYPLAMPLAETAGPTAAGINLDYSSGDQPLTLTPAAETNSKPSETARQPVSQLAGFAWSTEEQWNLPFTIKRLQRGGQYEILLHQSWRQTASARDNPVPLNIAVAFDQQNRVISATQQLNEAAYQTLADTNSNNGLAENDRADAVQNGLFGTFAFSKGRYLHLTMDMVLVEQQANQVAETERYGFYAPNQAGEAFSFGLDRDEPNYNYYHLKETRRIKTEATHYFDHPAFSVLAFVSKVEEPAPAPEPAPGPATP